MKLLPVSVYFRVGLYKRVTRSKKGFLFKRKKMKQLVVYRGIQPTCRDMMKAPIDGKVEKYAKNSEHIGGLI